MAKIKPFQAVTYNPNEIKDISSVVCPPYDVISTEAEQYYHDLSPYNLIHILLGKDVPGEDKYRRAAGYFKDWLKNKILIQEASPAIYFYAQEYKIRGEKKTRLGFIALLRLGDKESAIFGHEHTRLAPKEDRLKLLKAVKANLSSIFVVFLDKKRIIQRTFQRQIQDEKPFIDITDENKVTHKLWRVTDPDILGNIQANMAKEDIFIADGHHRYEVACTYRDQMKQKLGEEFSGEENFNYILSYFTDTHQRGLSILPVHRLLKLDAPLDLKKLLMALREYFDTEEVKDKTQFLFLLEKGGRTEHVLGLYKDRAYWLLRLKNIRILDKEIPDKPKAWRSLDVCILNVLVFQKVLGLGSPENLSFSHDAAQIIQAVDRDPLCIGFFLNPVKIEQIINVASQAERMPPKTTFFYPKVLSGLVINKIE